MLFRSDTNTDKYTAKLTVTYERKSEHLPTMGALSSKITMRSLGVHTVGDFYPPGSTAQTAKGIVMIGSPLIVASGTLYGPIPTGNDPSEEPHNFACNEAGFEGMTGRWITIEDLDQVINIPALRRRAAINDRSLLIVERKYECLISPLGGQASTLLAPYYEVFGDGRYIFNAGPPLNSDTQGNYDYYVSDDYNLKLPTIYHRCVYVKN